MIPTRIDFVICMCCALLIVCFCFVQRQIYAECANGIGDLQAIIGLVTVVEEYVTVGYEGYRCSPAYPQMRLGAAFCLTGILS